MGQQPSLVECRRVIAELLTSSQITMPLEIRIRALVALDLSDEQIGYVLSKQASITSEGSYLPKNTEATSDDT